MKAGRYLKEGHGTVSSGVFLQVVLVSSILKGLDKCDSDMSQMSDLKQRSCLVPTNHIDISETYQR